MTDGRADQHADPVIASLNAQIEAQSSAGATGPPNGLMDSRDNLVQQLGGELDPRRAAAVPSLFTTGGATLVDGNSAANLRHARQLRWWQPVDHLSASGQISTMSLSGGRSAVSYPQDQSSRRRIRSVGAAALAAAVNARHRSASISAARSAATVLGRRSGDARPRRTPAAAR